jgi:signal transduction histidine kinase/HAMP domain-containing protein
VKRPADARDRGSPRRRWLSYQREQTLSQLLLAVLPLFLFGALALHQVGTVIGEEADTRTREAARSVASILARDASDLQTLLDSYTSWTVLQADVAADDEADIRSTVTDFQVDQGHVDAAVLLIGSRVIAAGDPAITPGLEVFLRQAVAAQPTTARTVPAYADLSDGLYLVATGTIDLAGRTGPGVVLAGTHPAAMAFAQRIDARFALQVRQLANIDVAVYDRRGGALLQSDRVLAVRLGTPDVAELPVARTVVQHPAPDFVDAITALTGRDGRVLGAVAVMSELSAVSILGNDLRLFLVATLGLTLALALVLTLYLSQRLRQRLQPIGDGIAAVARGDLAVRLPAGERDALERLAGSHNRLAAALERRERLVWQSVDALDNLRPDRPSEALAADVVAAARTVFGLDACRLVDPDGHVQAADPPSAVEAPPEGTSLARASVWREPDAPQLECWSPGIAGWATADHALFDLFARQAGVVIRDAGLFAETSRRAVRLGRINELQRDFLRGVSHNLQSPLTRILVMSDDLADQPAARVAEQARAIHANADRLAHVVDQLLTLSRLDAGAYEPAADIFALAPLVRHAWEAQGADRPLDLVDRSAGALAVADRAGVEQVLWVLLDNALRYAPAGPIHVGIAVQPRAASSRQTAAAAGHEFVVRIRDEGAGVPTADRTRIFERFQRGTNAVDHEGTGLGLNVARRLLRSMDGRIWYEDAPGGGAIFAFTIPAELPVEPT